MSGDLHQSLDAVQRWIQAVIVHPYGVAAGIESQGAQCEIEVTASNVDKVICRSLSQSSIERLEVYSNAYSARLLEVLIGEYPALVHAVTEEVFVGLALAYLQRHPPSSYTLADLGRSFPGDLAATRPPRETGDGPDWADFLIDLARLERIYSEVFDGPGTEGQHGLQPEDLQGLSIDAWLAVKLVPSPSLRIETFQFPVHDYASAVRHGQAPEPSAPNRTRLAITRRDYIVRRTRLDEDEFTVLRSLVDGQSVGNALAAAMSAHAESADSLADNVQRWFRNWSAAGYFTGMES